MEIEICPNLPDLTEKILARAQQKYLEPGEILLEENTSLHRVPLVLKGRLKVVRTESDGREILLYHLQAGESCIMSLLGGLHGGKSPVRAVVETPVQVLLLKVEDLRSLLAEYPEWMDHLLKLYHQRYSELLEVIHAVSFQRLDQRLTELLRKKAELEKTSELTTTHEALALELGSSRVVISRLLRQLEDSGVVRLGRNKIRLV